MSRRWLAFPVFALLIFVLHQPNLFAQIAPMCDSGGVRGTNTTIHLLWKANQIRL